MLLHHLCALLVCVSLRYVATGGGGLFLYVEFLAQVTNPVQVTSNMLIHDGQCDQAQSTS